MFENRVLRRLFGPKRDQVTGEWRKLHNEELSDLYCLPNTFRVIKSRRMRWAGHATCMVRGVYRVLVGKPRGKSPLEGHKRRWEDNFKMDLQEVRCQERHHKYILEYALCWPRVGEGNIRKKMKIAVFWRCAVCLIM